MERTTFTDSKNNLLPDKEGNPRTAISLVDSISFFDRDRIFVNADPALYMLVINDPNFKSAPGHKGFPNSYKNTGPEHAGLQLSFNKTGTQIDVDSDIHNAAFSNGAAVKHFFEAAGNTILRRKTNPYEIYRRLKNRGERYKPNYNLR